MNKLEMPNRHTMETVVLSLMAVAMGAYAGDSFQSEDVIGGIIGLIVIGIVLTFLKFSFALTERRTALHQAQWRVRVAERALILAMEDHHQQNSEHTADVLNKAEEHLARCVKDLEALLQEQNKLK